MGYKKEKKEILCNFKNISHNHRELSPIKEAKPNKILSTSIILLPIFCFIYIISKHSTELINERISIFSLILLIILSFLLVLGIYKERKIKRKSSTIIINTILSFLYISIFSITLYFLYGNNSLKYFLVEKAMLTTNHQYLATWFYDDETINKTLSSLKNNTELDTNGFNKINFDKIKETELIYANKYEEAILDNKKNLYKKIEIKTNDYNGYILVIYDSTKIELIKEISKIEETIEDKTNLDKVAVKDIDHSKKNLLSFKNGKLIFDKKEYDNQSCIEYKEIILKDGLKYNQENIYKNEMVIGQREDNIVLILMLENANNLTNKEIIKILELYDIKNAIVSNYYNQIEIDKEKIIVNQYEEN